MVHNKSWKLLSWNVSGLNSNKKWNSIRDKIMESKSVIICLQETKKETFDINFIKNLCPLDFDSFKFLPSVGASGGILVVWKKQCFHGTASL
jgi:exonuclease III